MPKTIETRNRSRIEILNYILNFSTTRYFGEKQTGYDNLRCNIEHSFREASSGAKPIGHLVMPTSCQFTKYYLSWLIDYKEEGFGGSWLLQSIEDGSMCWWSNIGLYAYPKEQSDKFPQWKWNDKQWEVWDRWKRAGKRRDAYITLPTLPEFTEDGGVILRTRTRFGIAFGKTDMPERKFDNWKKVTLKQMLEFYDYASSL